MFSLLQMDEQDNAKYKEYKHRMEVSHVIPEHLRKYTKTVRKNSGRSASNSSAATRSNTGQFPSI